MSVLRSNAYSNLMLAAGLVMGLPAESVLAAIARTEARYAADPSERGDHLLDALLVLRNVAGALARCREEITESLGRHEAGRQMLAELEKLAEVVGAAGLEPATVRVEAGCSDPSELRPDASDSTAAGGLRPHEVPGRRARHCMITAAERGLRGSSGMLDDAMRQLRAEYAAQLVEDARHLDACEPAIFHLILTVERRPKLTGGFSGPGSSGVLCDIQRMVDAAEKNGGGK